MAGTGIKGYTGSSLYGGSYNISNGIIQNGSSGYSPTSSPANNSISSVANAVGSAVAHNISSTVGEARSRASAANAAQIAGTSPSDYGDYIRELLELGANNTAQSQAFAREQMEYQRQSDATAMAWSANEAEKNRQWQERLSNSAHQREVLDLMAAGLNPILSANNGAYTGSGATGQGFSSSGAMGAVDTSATNALGSLMATMINTASQASIAKMYTDSERYRADLEYSSSRLATEASILNNQNTNSSTRRNVLDQIAGDLERTRIAGEYGLGSAQISAEGALGVASLNNSGANYRTELEESGKNKRQEDSQEHDQLMQYLQQKHELTVEDKKILGAYGEKAMQILYGSFPGTLGNAIATWDQAEQIMRKASYFLSHPKDAYDEWKSMQKKGAKDTLYGYLFGYS